MSLALHSEGQVGERPNVRSPLRLGIGAVLLFFGALIAWGSFASLSSAAVARGQVRAESHRKTIQHLEGGIVREILVKEGQLVRKGQLLVRLDDTQSGAASSLYGDQRDALKVLEARLVAERDGLGAIRFPTELEARRGEPAIAQMMAGQERLFRTRRQLIAGQVDVQRQKIAQLGDEAAAYRAQAMSADEQSRLTQQEIEDVRDLLAKGLSTRPRLLALERTLARLAGDKGQYLSLIARSRQSIGEAQLQIANLHKEHSNEVAAELREVQTKLAEFEDRFVAAADIRKRTEIVAPQDGRVMNIRQFTPGGVIRPGDPILDIVPLGDDLVIDARVSPYDIDNVQAGLKAEVKLSAYKQNRLPVLVGEVSSVSADVLVDERTDERYYAAQIVLPVSELQRLQSVRLSPGMPAEVFILTGDRSPLRYLIDPLTDSYRRSLRES